MMKIPNLITMILLLGLSACQCKVLTGPERCRKQQFDSFKRQSDICADASIRSYHFQGQLVYLFGYGTCIADMTTTVMASDCRILGYLGGFAGNGRINGADFWSEATLVEIIWQA